MTSAPPKSVASSAATLTTSPEWRALAQHADAMRDVHLRTLFADDATRGTRFVAEAAGLYVDYSKHRATRETLDRLFAVAKAARLGERI